MKQSILFFQKLCLLLSAILLLAGCSGSESEEQEKDGDSQPEIRLNAEVWSMMEGTRATFYNTGTLASGSFTAAAYSANTATAYISPVTVNWDTDKWAFSDGKHYWPASGALDFFAYMPIAGSRPSYISAVTYAVNGTAPAPYFTCADLPLSLTPVDATQEFVWALVAEQDKAGTNSTNQPTAGQVKLEFRHPFARVRFKLSAESGINVKVNKITIPDLYRDGTCTLTGTGSSAVSTWSSLGNGSDDFVISGNPATNNDAAYLVIPNEYGSKTLTVNATWDDWSNVTTNVSASVNFNWTAGYSYTYNLTLSKYALKVDTEKYTEQW